MMNNPDSTIVHFDLDSFFVSVERLLNPGLIGKPVIVGGLSDRGVVASCSYEARKFGVHSAMPVKMALNLCREAIVVRGNMDLYTEKSKIVTRIIADQAPLYEKASIDEHYLDISGMDRFIGASRWARELRARIIRETGLPISMCMSVNKTIAKIATGEAKPNGEKEVPREMVQAFLNPLPISKIPGIGDKTSETLHSMGIEIIESLSSMSPEMLQSILGKNGLDIWKKANGIYFSPVIPYSEEKSISTEQTFESDTFDRELLTRILIAMTEKIAFRLRKRKKQTSVVTVKIRYSNFDTFTRQKKIAYTSLDHLLISTALELFGQLCQWKMPVRLIGVRLGGLVNGVQQLELFDDNEKMIRLYSSMDQIRTKYGTKAVRRASGISRDKR